MHGEHNERYSDNRECLPMTLVEREAKPKQIYYQKVAPYLFKRTVDCRRFIVLCKNGSNKLSDTDTGESVVY